MEIPKVINKTWLALLFERSFRWVRRNLLTDKVITEELGFDLKTFNRWRDFPPNEGNKLKQWLIDNQHIIIKEKKETWAEHTANLKTYD